MTPARNTDQSVTDVCMAVGCIFAPWPPRHTAAPISDSASRSGR
ncbi:MAG: hypothetical protein V9G19_21990 [Tetrasphaera sp.]